MTLLKTLATGALLFGATTASAADITIDFEGLASGTAIDNQFAAQGVTFTSDGDPTTLPRISAGVYGPSQVLADLTRDVTVPGSTFNIRADFTSVVSDVSVDVTSADGVSVIASIFDTGGTLLNSITTGAMTLGTYETLLLGGSDVAYAIFTTSQPNVAVSIIDNLSYTTAAVPLPAGLPLLLGALGGLGLMRRRSGR